MGSEEPRKCVLYSYSLHSAHARAYVLVPVIRHIYDGRL